MATVSMVDKAMQTDPPIDQQKIGPCIFLKLPVELRLHIYAYLWEPIPPYVSITIKGSSVIRDGPPFSGAPGLMGTCRTLNVEIGNILYYRHFAVTIVNHSATLTFGQKPRRGKCSKDFLRHCGTVSLSISFNGALWNLPAAVLLDKFHETLVLLRANRCLEEFDINVNLMNVDMLMREEVMGELASTQERLSMDALDGDRKLDKLALGWRMLWKLTAVLERKDVCQPYGDLEVGGRVVGYDGVNFEFF